jgi:hypothetical protein
MTKIKEEEYNGCRRMTGKATLAPAKRRGVAMMTMMHSALHLVKEEHRQQCHRLKGGKDEKDGTRQCTPTQVGGHMAATIDNRSTTEEDERQL